MFCCIAHNKLQFSNFCHQRIIAVSSFFGTWTNLNPLCTHPSRDCKGEAKRCSSHFVGWWLFLTIRFAFWQRNPKYFLLSLHVALLVAFTKHSCVSKLTLPRRHRLCTSTKAKQHISYCLKSCLPDLLEIRGAGTGEQQSASHL